MVYKILMLAKEDEHKPLWSPIMNKSTNPDGTFTYSEYSTEDENELEKKLLDIIQKYGASKIRVITDVDYDLDNSPYGNSSFDGYSTDVFDGGCDGGFDGGCDV